MARVDENADRLTESSSSVAPVISDEEPLGEMARRYMELLLAGDRHSASRMITEAVASGVGVRDIYLHVFQRTQHEIGRLWQMGRVSIAQEHFSTASTQMIMGQLYPYVFASERRGLRLVAASVGRELHELGIRMVSDFFEMEGWDTYYLGANMPASSIVAAVEERSPQLLALSATMSFHVDQAAQVIRAVRATDAGAGVKVLVGGHPFNHTPDLWQSVGADGHAMDASQAVLLAEQLVAQGGGPGSEGRQGQESTGLPGMVGEEAEPPAGAGQGSLTLDDLSQLNNELVTIRRELAKRTAELEKLNEQKNQFLGMAAHDLRNPLGSILGFSEFLQRKAGSRLTEEEMRFISVIQENSKFMLRLVEDLLDISNIESGRLRLDLEEADLASLVDDRMQLHRPIAETKGIGLRFEADGELPAVTVDRLRIGQVIDNLLSNALKYSPSKSRVVVRIAADGDEVILSVQDEGPGIPAEEMGMLFEPFSMLSVVSIWGEKSTGLGLAIVRRIVAEHGGRVWADSEVGSGSTFCVSLPAAG
jgi:signal transduction histidine kinase/methanogenic corrinoid protein MtbC1